MSETTDNIGYDLSSVSDGVMYLVDGYIEYAEEVITSRALPSVYDGLKPVNRRILKTLWDKRKKNNAYIKSARAAGDTLALHPHGDNAVYEAMVLMTQKNGSLAFPTVDGSGTFGGVYKDDPPAAQRYTEVRLHEDADREYFGEMNGINMIPNFDATLTEPEYLPVSFPAVLVNSTSGIAVGFRCNIPSFNFNDVCDLVIENIKDGECHTVIAPDFVTGGYYVKNDKELLKLMKVGTGKIKLRGRYSINNKEIVVEEVPYGKTIQRLIKQINSADIPSIRNAYDSDDYDHHICFTVDCTAKSRVEEALYAMYKNTDFQYTYSADITVIVDGTPVKMGVWQIIDTWVKWRRQVLEKEYTYRKEGLLQAIRESEAFMNVVNDRERCEELTRIIVSEGKKAGKQYVTEHFTREEVPEDLIDFVSSRSIPNYCDGGKYKTEYQGYLYQVESLNRSLGDLDAVIIAQMQELKKRYGSRLKRRTEITNVDYSFTSANDVKEKVLDTSKCYYECKNNFLKKLRFPDGSSKAEFKFEGTASDTLIAFDNRGRVLRIYTEELPVNSAYDTGIYLPRYFGLEEDDDYRITYIGVLDGSELMLLYRDGYVGFVDTKEWSDNNRRIKVLQKGIHPESAEVLGAVLKDWNSMLFVTDTTGRISWVYTDDIKHKNRTARTRVFNLYHDNPIDSYVTMPADVGSMYLGNLEVYKGKLTKLRDVSDFRGKAKDFTMIL